jgi:DNA-binding response OmpR family regulator
MSLSRPVVLIVDDDVGLCGMIEQMLEPDGYAVEATADGATGVARVAAGGVDVVLLDVMLPGLDGHEVCRRIRADERAGYVPIIMLTALADPATRAAGFAAGADDYVTKPFTAADLSARIHVWVQARQRLESARLELQQLAATVLQEQAELRVLTERLWAVLQDMAAADVASSAAWREELEAIAAALAGRIQTLPLRA